MKTLKYFNYLPVFFLYFLGDVNWGSNVEEYPRVSIIFIIKRWASSRLCCRVQSLRSPWISTLSSEGVCGALFIWTDLPYFHLYDFLCISSSACIWYCEKLFFLYFVDLLVISEILSSMYIYILCFLALSLSLCPSNRFF